MNIFEGREMDMEIFSFNFTDDKDRVIDGMYDVYNTHPELFEDFAYCHYDIDDLTGDIYLFDNFREAEYKEIFDYIIDDDGYIEPSEVKDCVEYFYDKLIEKADERTSSANQYKLQL